MFRIGFRDLQVLSSRRAILALSQQNDVCHCTSRLHSHSKPGKGKRDKSPKGKPAKYVKLKANIAADNQLCSRNALNDILNERERSPFVPVDVGPDNKTTDEEDVGTELAGALTSCMYYLV